MQLIHKTESSDGLSHGVVDSEILEILRNGTQPDKRVLLNQLRIHDDQKCLTALEIISMSNPIPRGNVKTMSIDT